MNFPINEHAKSLSGLHPIWSPSIAAFTHFRRYLTQTEHNPSIRSVGTRVHFNSVLGSWVHWIGRTREEIRYTLQLWQARLGKLLGRMWLSYTVRIDDGQKDHGRI